MASSTTKPGTRKPSSPTRAKPKRLSEVARKVVAPDGITATGWPAVEQTCRVRLGVEFDEWQHGAGRLILAKRADGKLACMIGGVGMSLPRQVGKTYLIGAMVFALCINQPGMLVIWSAHHARTHGETFLAMQAFADRSRVKPYIAQVFKGSGDEEIRFGNGSRILFGARERGFGRGIPGVDMIVSDEAQIMSDKALDAQLATMNTSSFGLAIYVGTPPRPDDPSEAFTRMRTEAWKGTLRDAAWIEFGAESDVSPTDRKAWAKANPSYPKRTPTESILRLQRKLTPESFLREGLGVWDKGSGRLLAKFPSAWSKATTPGPKVSFALHVTPDRSHSAVAVASVRGDGVLHLELLDHRDGVSWLAPWLTNAVAEFKPQHLALAGAMAAGALAPDLEKLRGFKALNSTEVRRACAGLYDLVNADGKVEVRVTDADLNAVLESAVSAARRSTERGEWVFDADPDVDLSPLYALALAAHVVRGQGPKKSDAELLASAH